MAYPTVAQEHWGSPSQSHGLYLGPGSHWARCGSAPPTPASPSQPLAGPPALHGGILRLTSILSTQGGDQEDNPQHLGDREGECQGEHGQEDREAASGVLCPLHWFLGHSLEEGKPQDRKSVGCSPARSDSSPELLPDQLCPEARAPRGLFSCTFSVPL